MDDNICQMCLSKDRRLVPQRNLSSLLQEINIWETKECRGGICWECHRMLVKFKNFRAQIRLAQESIIYMVQDTKSLSHLSTETKTYYDYQFCHTTDPLTNVSGKIEIDIKKEPLTDTDKVSNFTRSDFLERHEKLEARDDDNHVDLFKDNDDFIEPDSNDEKPIINFDDKRNVSNEMVYAETIKASAKHRVRKLGRKVVKKNESSKVNEHSQKAYVKKKYNKVNDSQKQEEELREKFITVVLSEEEMMKNREEKRNHYNYKKIPFKCDSCVLGFTTQERFRDHVEKKHNENIGPYVCDVCLIRFPNKGRIERHCRKHFVCYHCRLCKYETVEAWSALNHCRAKHSADKRGSIHCEQCQAVAKTPEDLAEHIRSQHSLFCNECGEKFKGKHTLRTHLARIHRVKREFICDICTRSFVSKTRLESHMVTHNPALARRLAYCDTCRVQYKNIHVYRSHVRNSASHAERAYPCPECNKKFVSKMYWTKHYNFYHLQKSEFNCDICNKLFISDWRLKNHKQVHHGLTRPRDHPCNVCGMKFYTQSTLRGHQLTHSSQRSYMCEDCGDTFRQRPALYTHARLVHRGVKRSKLP